MYIAKLSMIEKDENETVSNEYLSKELLNTKDQIKCLRRGLFSRYDKLVLDTHEELNKIRQELYSLKKHLRMEDVENKILNIPTEF